MPSALTVFGLILKLFENVLLAPEDDERKPMKWYVCGDSSLPQA